MAAALPNIQSVSLGGDVISRQRIFAATDAAHDHGAGWRTAGGGILARALGEAMTEDDFVARYSTESLDKTRYTNAEARIKAAYEVPFYPKTDSWKPGFVFAPFGPLPWLTAHDAGSSHPGQRPCLHYNLADTASRLRTLSSKPVFCKLPNLFLSAAELGTNPLYVEAVVFYGFSRFTDVDWANTAMDSNKKAGSFNPQKDGGKVKCKILMKMSPAGNGAFAWYDLTDTSAASQPRSFTAAVESAKWKVLNMNAGYFMGNDKSAELFKPDMDPAKILLATMAKLIGDMSTALASSAWMAQFHPGGRSAISNDWFDAWTGAVALNRQIPILGESGDRLQVWQGSDRNGATLYTGSRQDETKLQTARFMPSEVNPEQQRRFMEGRLQSLHATLDSQYSELLANVNTYIDDVRSKDPTGLFKDTAYANVKEGNHLYVTEQLEVYLLGAHEQIRAVYDKIKEPGSILDQTHPDKYASLTYEQIKGLHDELSLRIVDLMPQKTSLFIKEPTKLHKAFQIMKGVALLPSPSDAITKINTTARYRTQRGGATSNDALDAFAIALRISMPPSAEDPMFLQFANMIPAAPAPVAAPVELGDGEVLPPIDFRTLFVPPGGATIERAKTMLNEIHEPTSLDAKWIVMKGKWDIRDKGIVRKTADIELWDEILNSNQITEDTEENLSSDEENVLAIIGSPPSIILPPGTNDTAADQAFVMNHFVPYGAVVNGRLPDRYSSDIQVAPPVYHGFTGQFHPTMGTSGRSVTGGPSARATGLDVLAARERRKSEPGLSGVERRKSEPGLSGVKRRQSQTGLRTFADVAREAAAEEEAAAAAAEEAGEEMAPAAAAQPVRRPSGYGNIAGLAPPAPASDDGVVMNAPAASSARSGGRKTHRRRRLPKLL